MGGVMTPYIVRQGDYLAKLAFVHGFDADEVWNDPANEDLRKLRPDPNILAPGDILRIPEKQKEERDIEKGTDNDYEAMVPSVEVVLVFQDGDDPLANEPCEIRGLGGSEGAEPTTTDAEGKLTLKIPVTTREVTVSFPKRELTQCFRVGDMDPESETSGIKKRLVNLGYLPSTSPQGMEEDEVLRIAILAFQRKHALETTGTLDDSTRKAIVDEHSAENRSA